jgi:hypothetical protein
MQDEQFMRQWNVGHDRLSLDLDRGIGKLGRRFARPARGRSAIGNVYGIPTDNEARKGARIDLSPAAKASLRGFAASVFTFLLWVTVMVLATPTPGQASPLLTTAAGECAAQTVTLA